MKVLFWNIGDKVIKPYKFDVLKAVMNTESPEILCLAEGPKSILKTKELEAFLEGMNYKVYYSPTFYSQPVIDRKYKWTRLGLKVYYSANCQPDSKFEFIHQKVDGRIIFFRFKYKQFDYSLFLVHAPSKMSDDMDHASFIVELHQLIKSKNRQYEKDNTIILGDFNVEPWEKGLQKKRYVYSLFYKKIADFYKNSTSQNLYFCPALEYIQNSKDANLIGTFYNEKHIGLLDFPLLSLGSNYHDFEFKIITEIGKLQLFNKKKAIIHDFDHLPITLKLK